MITFGIAHAVTNATKLTFRSVCFSNTFYIFVLSNKWRMNKLELALGNENISSIITALKEKNYDIASWLSVKKDYEPDLHNIVTDHVGRKDKVRKDEEGRILSMDKASRTFIGLEKLHTERISQFMFSIPVKRIYHNTENNSKREEIAKVLELIYKHSRIDKENPRRAESYFASCQIFTIWYIVKKKNNLYGFPCDYKLKCKTISPMDGYDLYPLFDEYGDMLAMSYEYKISNNGNDIIYFETYTANKHYLWKRDDKSLWVEAKPEEDIEILKIPGSYLWRKKPIFHGLSHIREELEYTISRNSDVVAYNSAPVLKVVGEITGTESKGEAQRIFRVENGGDVGYVSWSQSVEALKYHVETLNNLYWTQAQMPDISFFNMKGLGNIGYDARMTMFTDAYLKIGKESGEFIEFFERECNVVKAFLGKIRTDFASELDNVEVEHIITPYVQKDEDAVINRLVKANGGKPLLSHLDSIKMADFSYDAQKTYEAIIEEEARATGARMNDLFNEGAV